MSAIKVFENSVFGKVRTVMRDNEPWFVAADVCKALDVQNPTDAIKKLDDDEKARFNLGLRGGETNIVNEPGLYSLVLGSRKPEAKAFKRWVTHEILPELRKTGRYEDSSRKFDMPKDYPSALRALADQVEANQTLIAQNQILSGEILSWDFDEVIPAIVRRYSSRLYGDKFAFGWKAFYKELYYKHSIGLEGRKTADVNKNPKNAKRATYKYLTEEEKPLALQTVVAMCLDAEVDISDYLKKYASENSLVG